MVEVDTSLGEKKGRRRYVVRHLKRLPPQTTFPQVVERASGLSESVHQLTRSRPSISIDATGLGQPVIDLFKDALPNNYIEAVYFTHGDRRTDEEYGRVTLGKAHLITQLQTLLQTQRLLLPESQEAADLARDLQEYEIQIQPDANERYGAFSIGPRDDQVTALGLAVQTTVHTWGYITR